MAAAACLLAAFCFNAAFFNAPALAQCVGTTSVTCSGTIFNPGGDGFGTGGENGISITVQPGASVTGGVFDGLFIGSDNTVTNFGTIVGQTGYGINASGDLTVFNSGEISGLADDGIIASDIFLTNFSAGVISGSDVGVNGDNVTLTNYGTITGGQIGVQAAAGLASIVNYGTIAGGNSPFFESEIFANRVNVFNAGTISGYIGVMAGLGGGSVLVNAGRIVGTFAAIDFTASGGDTLTFLPGSRLVGSVELGNGNGASTVNIVTGRDVGWLLTFGACGCGGLIENQSIVRFSGGAPAVVSGNQIATLDPTAFGLADRNLVDFTGWISSLFSGRLGETGPANAAFAAYAPPANPASAVARDAFASARPADAQEAPARVFCRTPSRSIRDRERRSGPRVLPASAGRMRTGRCSPPRRRVMAAPSASTVSPLLICGSAVSSVREPAVSVSIGTPSISRPIMCSAESMAASTARRIISISRFPPATA